jgi:hypothetical protein
MNDEPFLGLRRFVVALGYGAMEAAQRDSSCHGRVCTVLFVESRERDREGPHCEFGSIRAGGYERRGGIVAEELKSRAGGRSSEELSPPPTTPGRRGSEDR